VEELDLALARDALAAATAAVAAAGGDEVAKAEAMIAVEVTDCNYTAFYCTSLHFTALHCILLHCRSGRHW
jgi:hypothetical protein